MKLEIREIRELSNAQDVWVSLMSRAVDSWTWHRYELHTYRRRISELMGEDVVDYSFLVAMDGEPVCLAPVLVRDVAFGDFVGRELGYRGWPLPWPCFAPEIQNRDEVESFAFDHIEEIARKTNAGRISLILSPAKPAGDEESRFARVVRSRRYMDMSYPSHNIILDRDTLSNVRKRYRRYVKHYGPGYDVRIVEGEAVDDVIEETYYSLHVKDAGGKFRPRETYKLQADLARSGEAFYVVARNIAANEIVGMLMVEFVHGAAYDGSVAVDPDYQQEYVSHIMKWHAIETLMKRNATSYELGINAFTPNPLWQPSEKNYGISYFKEGWSRGCKKKVLVAEKYFSRGLLEAFFRERVKDLVSHFQI
jgi:hypothetical protein